MATVGVRLPLPTCASSLPSFRCYQVFGPIVAKPVKFTNLTKNFGCLAATGDVTLYRLIFDWSSDWYLNFYWFKTKDRSPVFAEGPKNFWQMTR